MVDYWGWDWSRHWQSSGESPAPDPERWHRPWTSDWALLNWYIQQSVYREKEGFIGIYKILEETIKSGSVVGPQQIMMAAQMAILNAINRVRIAAIQMSQWLLPKRTGDLRAGVGTALASGVSILNVVPDNVSRANYFKIRQFWELCTFIRDMFVTEVPAAMQAVGLEIGPMSIAGPQYKKAGVSSA